MDIERLKKTDVASLKISDIELEKISRRALEDTRRFVGFTAWRTGIACGVLWLATLQLWRAVSPIPGLPEELRWGVATVASAAIVFVGVLVFSFAAAPYRIERDRRQKLFEGYRTLHGIARELREALRASRIDLERDLSVAAENGTVRLHGWEMDAEEGVPPRKRWMFMLDKVTLINRSEQSRLSLDVYLTLPRTVEASRGDDLVLRERPGSGLYLDPDRIEWLESPIELDPGETASGQLGFWVPIWAFDDAEELEQVKTEQAVLRFHDHVSGQSMDYKLRDCVSDSASPSRRRRTRPEEVRRLRARGS